MILRFYEFQYAVFFCMKNFPLYDNVGIDNVSTEQIFVRPETTTIHSDTPHTHVYGYELTYNIILCTFKNVTTVFSGRPDRSVGEFKR